MQKKTFAVILAFVPIFAGLFDIATTLYALSLNGSQIVSRNTVSIVTMAEGNFLVAWVGLIPDMIIINAVLAVWPLLCLLWYRAENLSDRAELVLTVVFVGLFFAMTFSRVEAGVHNLWIVWTVFHRFPFF